MAKTVNVKFHLRKQKSPLGGFRYVPVKAHKETIKAKMPKLKKPR